ncbi:MAG: hypothetical protein D6805_02265 [Planctomycetota bacterium]|nr:MAG: hypothetical protein D6805_02265 [Planctomycetota bacterium]
MGFTSVHWKEVCALLFEDVGQEQYELWIKPLYFMGEANGVIHLEAPTVFAKHWINRFFIRTITFFAQEVSGEKYRVAVRCPRPHLNVFRPNHIVEEGRLRPDFIFENFVEDSANEFALYSAKLFAREEARYNLLYLYGPSQVGKTHLLQAICHYFLEKEPFRHVVYATCEEFFNSYECALATKTQAEFLYRHQNAGVFVLEDLQYLTVHPEHQPKMIRLFDALYNSNKYMAFSCDRHPNCPSFSVDLASRLHAGIVAELKPPSLEASKEILRRKAAFSNISLPESLLSHMVHDPGSVRRNYGTVLTLSVSRSMEAENARMAELIYLFRERSLKAMLARDLAKEGEGKEKEVKVPPPPKVPPKPDFHPKRLYQLLNKKMPFRPPMITHSSLVEKAILATSARFKVTLKELYSKKRSKKFVRARQAAMYVMRYLFRLTFKQIGEYFGNRHSSTVQHAVKRIEEQIKTDPSIEMAIDDLIQDVKDEIKKVYYDHAYVRAVRSLES